MILVGTESGHVRVIQAGSRTFLRDFRRHKVRINSIGVAPSKVVLASGADEKVVRIWEMSSLEPIHEIEAHEDYVKCLSFIN